MVDAVLRDRGGALGGGRARAELPPALTLVEGAPDGGAIPTEPHRKLLRLFGELGEIRDVESRRSHLLARMREIVGAASAVLVFVKGFGPSGGARRGTTTAYYLENQTSVTPLTIMQPFLQHGTSFDPALARLSTLRSTGGVVTRRRRDLVEDPAWYDGSAHADHLRAIGIDDGVFSALELGAPDFIMGLALRRARGERPFSAEDASLLHLCSLEVEAFVGSSAERAERAIPRRQRQTLNLLLEGASEKEIAYSLGVSTHTVHTYVKALYKTHGVRSRGELLAQYVRPGRRPNGRPGTVGS
jgi:DNA-binding CsgD family transcriptional regulator